MRVSRRVEWYCAQVAKSTSCVQNDFHFGPEEPCFPRWGIQFFQTFFHSSTQLGDELQVTMMSAETISCLHFLFLYQRGVVFCQIIENNNLDYDCHFWQLQSTFSSLERIRIFEVNSELEV